MVTLAGNISSEPLAYTVATEADQAAIVELVQSFRHEWDGLIFSEEDLIACPESPGHPACHLRESIQNPDSLVLLVKHSEQLVGFLKFDRGKNAKIRHRGVFTMALRQSHWGRGIGRTLLRRMEEWAKTQGILRLELSVLENNLRAIYLYERAGYQMEGYKKCAALLQDRYIGGYWMAKILGP